MFLYVWVADEINNGVQTYLKPYISFAKDAFAKLSPTGSLCWEVGNYVQAGEVYPLDIYF